MTPLKREHTRGDLQQPSGRAKLETHVHPSICAFNYMEAFIIGFLVYVLLAGVELGGPISGDTKKSIDSAIEIGSILLPGPSG